MVTNPIRWFGAGLCGAKKATLERRKCTNLTVWPDFRGPCASQSMTMLPLSPIRLLALSVGISASAAMGQSTLPPTAPTVAPAPLAIGTAGPVANGTAVHKAEVEYVGGLLRVSANNSSLNQILREIGWRTGMKITGGVTEDYVFGTYGPAPASQVITSLLDGTSSNVMIVENSADGPAELILTPRHGGPTPPNPNAASNMENDDQQRQRSGPPRGQYVPPRAGAMWEHPPGPGGTPNGLPASNGGQTGTPINGGADLGTTPGAFTPNTPPDARAQPDSVLVNTDNPVSTPVTPASTDGSQPQSPNGVSTPQQIYEQLQKLRQQQQTANPQ